MKTEKICISKKNLIIPLIVVFLLGVVGVSYMVQKNLTLRSKANERDANTACRTKFNEIISKLLTEKGTYTYPAIFTQFEDSYIGNQEQIAPAGLTCGFGRDYPYADKCCLSKISLTDGTTPVEQGLSTVGIEYKPDEKGPFKIIQLEGRSSQIENPTTCVNYGVAGNPTRSCGSNVKYKESCDGGERIVHVSCENKSTSDQPPGNNSCGFTCENAQGNPIYECDKSTTCLAPTKPPAPTVIPTSFKVIDCKKIKDKEGKDIEVNHCWIPEKDLILKGTQAMFESKSNNKNVYVQTKADKLYRLVSRDGSGYEQCVNREGFVGICASIEEKWNTIP